MSFAKISVGRLSQEWAWSNELQCHYLEEIDSTNRAAKELSRNPEVTRQLFVADHQTAGRGRGKNSWSDVGRGEQLLSSWVFQQTRPFQHTTAQLFGLALYQAATQTYPSLPWSLKAPNDLYINHLKVAGLLIEMISGGPKEQVIVGLGLNVHSHPRDVTTATHLMLYEPEALERWFEFLSNILTQFTIAAELALVDQLSDATRLNLLAALNRHPLLAEPYVDVDADGNLRTATQHILWTEL